MGPCKKFKFLMWLRNTCFCLQTEGDRACSHRESCTQSSCVDLILCSMFRRITQILKKIAEVSIRPRATDAFHEAASSMCYMKMYSKFP